MERNMPANQKAENQAAGTQPGKPADAATRIAAIRRHLNKWELAHLRALAAAQADRLEKAEEELARARDDANAAWRDAEFWQTQAQTLIEELREAGTEVGMLPTGELVPMPMAGVDVDAVPAAREGGAA
jgi:hypothetical protein